MIRMCHQGLKVSFIEWWFNQNCCMGQSVGQSKMPTSEDKGSGNENAQMDVWAHLEKYD